MCQTIASWQDNLLEFYIQKWKKIHFYSQNANWPDCVLISWAVRTTNLSGNFQKRISRFANIIIRRRANGRKFQFETSIDWESKPTTASPIHRFPNRSEAKQQILISLMWSPWQPAAVGSRFEERVSKQTKCKSHFVGHLNWWTPFDCRI